jgi:hypothetical protein
VGTHRSERFGAKNQKPRLDRSSANGYAFDRRATEKILLVCPFSSNQIAGPPSARAENCRDELFPKGSGLTGMRERSRWQEIQNGELQRKYGNCAQRSFPFTICPALNRIPGAPRGQEPRSGRNGVQSGHCGLLKRAHIVAREFAISERKRIANGKKATISAFWSCCHRVRQISASDRQRGKKEQNPGNWHK